MNIHVQLLSMLKIMDYSLLIGIHDSNRGNREGIRDNHYQFVTVSIKAKHFLHFPSYTLT